MRTFLSLLAIGAGAYAWSRRSAGQHRSGQGHAAFADDQPDTGDNPVRNSGPDAMRDPPRGDWSDVDEASDQSFPASDPPATY
jgi:hypothetical protein